MILMARHLTKSEQQEILRLSTEKLSHAVIAQRIGCSRQTVGRTIERASAPRKDAKDHSVRVRLTAKEAAALRQMAEAEDLSPSEMLRRLIRRAAGVPELSSGELRDMKQSVNQLNAAARNLVQLLQLARSGRLKWNKRDAALVAQLADHIEIVAEDMQVFQSAAARGAFLRVDHLGTDQS